MIRNSNVALLDYVLGKVLECQVILVESQAILVECQVISVESQELCSMRIMLEQRLISIEEFYSSTKKKD